MMHLQSPPAFGSPHWFRAPIVSAMLLSAIMARADSLANVDPKISAIEQSLQALDDDAQRTHAELARIDTQQEMATKGLRVRGRALYKLLRAGMLPAGGGLQAFFAHIGRMERLRRNLEREASASRSLADRSVALHKHLDDISGRRSPLELSREAATHARVALEEVDDRRRAFDRAFQHSSGAGEYIAVYGADGTGQEPARDRADWDRRESFASMKGRLPIPVAGRTEIKSVRREGAGGPGLEMHAPIGTAARAIYGGRVAFADQYGPSGQTVILDHGDHFYSLLGNLGHVDVRVGDDVSSGARIGTVGDGGKGGILYFEVRKGNTTLDPNPWLGL